MEEQVYLDHNSTTQCDPAVVEEMVPYFVSAFANPSSPHSAGQSARRAVDSARSAVAKAIGAEESEIVFTAGATESNNIIFSGICRGVADSGRVLVSQVEHKSVLKPARELESYGYDVFEIPVDSAGRIDLEWLECHLTPETILVSVQAANNETGCIQSISDVAEMVRPSKALLHTDAAQALGRIPVDVAGWGVDFASFSAHKAHGPKGVGALYVHGGAQYWGARGVQKGGGQEFGVRPGTENVPAIVGFGAACDLIIQNLETERVRFRKLRDEYESLVLDTISNAEVLSADTLRLPTTSNVFFEGIEADAVLARLDDVMLSSGSACESGALEPSHVLEAMGLTREKAYRCIRMAVGRYTRREHVCYAVQELAGAVKAVRAATAQRAGA